MNCTRNCNQGRLCTCEGGWRIDNGQDTPLLTPAQATDWTLVALIGGIGACLAFMGWLAYAFN